MPLQKTWLTTSRNPRPSHGQIAGETIPISQPFSNGLMYPGDGSQGPEEVANCRCIMLTSGKTKARRVNLQGSTMDKELREKFVARAEDIRFKMTQELDDQASRWTGVVRTEKSVPSDYVERFASNEVAATMDWEGVMNMSRHYTELFAAGKKNGVKAFAHEMAHSYSPTTAQQFAASKVTRAMEEGIVEGFSRAFVQKIGAGKFNDFGVYDDFVRELELSRVRAGVRNRLTWYRSLLKMTPKERVEAVGTFII